MVWLIIGLPLTAVVASIITVTIASRSADTLVRDEFQKEGLALNQVTERDRQAFALDVAAALRVSGDELQVELRSRLQSQPERLTLSLVHPTLVEKDVLVTLRHLGQGLYAGQIPNLRGVNWQVFLLPQDESWRLAGRWNMDSTAALRLTATNPDLSTHP